MNKFLQKFILYLIDRRIYKEEKKFRDNPVYTDGEVKRLKYLRWNILTINNPWQGVLSPWAWTRAPKNDKHVKPFPKLEEKAAEHPLSEDEQAWADLSNEEFFKKLDKVVE